MSPKRYLLGMALLGCSFLAAGCGGRQGNVSGKVEMDGKLVRSGTVNFFSAEGRVVSAAIGNDGSYAVANVPTGATKITVISPNPRKMPSGERGGKTIGPTPEELRSWFPLANKYAEPSTSGLSYEVATGSQSHDIKLQGPMAVSVTGRR